MLFRQCDAVEIRFYVEWSGMKCSVVKIGGVHGGGEELYLHHSLSVSARLLGTLV